MFDAVYFTFFWGHLKRLGRFGALVIACGNVCLPLVMMVGFLWDFINFFVYPLDISVLKYAMIAPAAITLLYYLIFGGYKRAIVNRKYALKKYKILGWTYYMMTFVWIAAIGIIAFIQAAK